MDFETFISKSTEESLSAGVVVEWTTVKFLSIFDYLSPSKKLLVRNPPVVNDQNTKKLSSCRTKTVVHEHKHFITCQPAVINFGGKFSRLDYLAG